MNVRTAPPGPAPSTAAPTASPPRHAGVERWLARLAIAAQLVFVAAWVVAGALEPGYSHAEQAISELGGRHAAHPWIVNAAIVLLGASVAALAPGLLRALPGGRAARVTAALFALAGVLYVLAAAFPVDCSMTVDPRCERAFEAGTLSWQHSAHLWSGLALRVVLVLTPFAVAWALRAGPTALASLAAGVGGVGIGVVTVVLYSAGAGGADGIVQRAEFLALHLWLVLVAAAILHATRPPRQPSQPTPLPPREFFGGPWAGDGEAFLRPAFLWRRFAVRFDCRRDATWVSDELGWFDDQVTFRGRWTERRRHFLQFVAPDHLHVTSDDLPDGAELTLEEAGYRIWPYRLLIRVGPVLLPVRVRDQHRLRDDGTLEDTLDLRLFGLPVGRLVFRVRPVPAEPGAGPPRRAVSA